MWKVLALCRRVGGCVSVVARAAEARQPTSAGLCVCCDWDRTDEALVYLSGPVWGAEE